MTRLHWVASVVLLVVAIILIAFLVPLRKTRSIIVRDSFGISRDAKGNPSYTFPLARLAKLRKPWPDNLTGRVAHLPSDPSSTKSLELVVIMAGTEPVIATNIPYLRTLETMYLGKEVRVSGTWRKKVVVFGKEYRSFWIEDVSSK